MVGARLGLLERTDSTGRRARLGEEVAVEGGGAVTRVEGGGSREVGGLLAVTSRGVTRRYCTPGYPQILCAKNVKSETLRCLDISQRLLLTTSALHRNLIVPAVNLQIFKTVVKLL